jgi:hypothetical protein
MEKSPSVIIPTYPSPQWFQVTELLRARHELRHGVGVYHHGFAALCLFLPL